MKAILLMQHGGPEMLGYGDAPDPPLSDKIPRVDQPSAAANDFLHEIGLLWFP